MFKVIKWLTKTLFYGLLLWLVITLCAVLLLRVVNPSTSVFMLTAGQPAEQKWVSLDTISPAMQLAVIAAEDQQFPHHNGFDWDQIDKAIDDYQQGDRLRGASTITQQTAKNLFGWRSRSWFRKGVETWFAFWLETLWPKERILEVYLNIAQFDGQHYGVELAAQEYFQRSASKLNADQAAWLAAVLPNPENRSIFLPDAETRRHQRWIKRQMRNLGDAYWTPQ